MIEIFNGNNEIVVKDSNKKDIVIKKDTKEISLDTFDVTYPGEYEKSGILLEVKEYEGNLYYNFLIEKKHLVVIFNDEIELKEEISAFFGDIDVLLITGTKKAAKIFENIEAKLVIPFGEGKDIFLNTLGQHIEEVESYKVKGDFSLDSTEFVNLK